MLQEVLKKATEKQHGFLEESMFVNQIMDFSLNFHQYKKILFTNYIVHACFEDNLFAGLSLDLKQKLHIENRRKLKALLEDLQEAGIYYLPEGSFNHETHFTGNAEILGAMYVLEGATLGGSVIVKKLKKNPNFQHLDLSFNYYQVYGNDLVPNWKQFNAVLNTQVQEADYQKSTMAALKLFDIFAAAQNGNENRQLVND